MKPMLAATCDDVSQLKFPLYASPKLDGVRALVIDGALRSRSLKPVPNPHVNKLFGRKELDGLDGELIFGPATAKDVYRQTVGAVSRDTGEPDVEFHVFDRWSRTGSFEDLQKLRPRMPKGTHYLEQHLVKTADELLLYESVALEQGYEGLILRSPEGLYKFGRSTLREQGMLKLKRFTDGEAELIGIFEEEHNANEAKKNALGRTERSTHQAGMVPTGRAGALQVRDLVSGVEFGIGTGLDDKDREWFWKLRGRVTKMFDTPSGGRRLGHVPKKAGCVLKYKSFLIGVKDLPRFPVYLGPRSPWDF